MSYWNKGKDSNIEELKGRILTQIEVNDDEILFTCDNGDKYLMYHYQDCCESVYIEDISGDIQQLVGSPLVMAEEVSNVDEGSKDDECDDSYTWTYYKFANNNVYVTIRWYGTSNGYYSESVDFIKLDKE